MIGLAGGWGWIFPRAFCRTWMRQNDGDVWKIDIVYMPLNDSTVKAF